MLGIAVYLYFLIIGYIYSRTLFRGKDLLFIIWMGLILGNTIAMIGVCISSIFLGFNKTSHIVVIVLTGMLAAILCFKNKEKNLKVRYGLENKGCMGYKTFIFLVIPFTLLIGLLFDSHVLSSFEGGGYASGQSTFGDLSMHLAFITSIEQQGVFPPNYSLLSGTKLNYPFFVDMLSSSLCLFGTSLRTSVIFPSVVLSMLIVMGIYFVAYKITGNKAASILSVIFILLCGGFGFSYFLDGSKQDPSRFTEIFSAFYHTPTNYNEYNIRWSNTICDMIIPQRTTMAGWAMIMPCLWLLIDGVTEYKRKSFVILGFLASCMPMIHTHSFLALGFISAGTFAAFLFRKNYKENLKNYFINWVIYGIIVLLIASPQLFYWTFSQTSGNDSFIRYQYNWVNWQDPYVWFYVKNLGIMAIFLIPAFIYAKKDKKRMFLSCLPLVITAELYVFQPNDYDNNKLFYIAYFIFVILISDYFVHLWDKFKDEKACRLFFAILIVFLGTFSGALTIAREWISGEKFQIYSEDTIEIAKYIKENTPKDALFLTGGQHLNPVASLAGRTIYLGADVFVFFHGFYNEFDLRQKNVSKAYSGEYEDLIAFCKNNNISYIYISSYERVDFDPQATTLDKLNKVFECGECALYKVD